MFDPTKYPETLTALQAVEDNKWAIGDALLKECGRGSGSYAKIMEVATGALDLIGREYSFDSLRRMRDTSMNFPPETRVAGLAWATHLYSTSPQLLKQFMAAMEDGEKLTQPKVRSLMRDLRAHSNPGISTAIATSRLPGIRTPSPVVAEAREEARPVLAGGELLLKVRLAKSAAKKALEVWQEHNRTIDPETIAQFITEAREAYTAWHNFIILADSRAPRRRAA